ncbi:O-acetyl-ADP-ribose deacetylase [Dysgonomonas sp. 216]|nr:O-acetyl-ADP-ribose deacetylase [Dysgonomonas sp. 216]
MPYEIELTKGDITSLRVDAIVNAANSSLMGGGGVDGAIHRKGGRQILSECIAIRCKQGKCKTGQAVYTSAGLLPSKFVIHTVGPIWAAGTLNEPELLAACYTNSLRIANELEVSSIAFPNISTGIYHYPKKEAALVAYEAVKNFMENENKVVNKVVFICFDDANYICYKDLILGNK